ncbi:ornithine--oxo-acid transaminase [Pseudomonas sp. RC10]|uniref:ornithine--oxo-acid transaminase n=1 Tax=Pseudomonas bambusae TaxID=3139142 RepID=UPI003139ECDF
MNAVTMIEREKRFCAHNYSPLPVVLVRGEGVWAIGSDGTRYLDMMSAYSAVSHGHVHPRIRSAAVAQIDKLSVISRAFYSQPLGEFLEALCRITGFDGALPMNSGAEAVETAIKAARRWGYRVKGIAPDQAEIVVADSNFHGRTSTIVGFSSEPAYRADFGPFCGGFKQAGFGDIESFRQVINANTCAVLIEPIQGEAGIRVPPAGFLRELRALCDQTGTLLILDEIQSGLGRTGKWFAFEHEEIRPDAVILGKALGGGIMPVSAFVARRELIDQFNPGSHGSTFGGNPLAAAVGLEALKVLEEEGLIENSARQGEYLKQRLNTFKCPAIREVRGRGLWIGIELDRPAKPYCEALLQEGVLTRETHENVLRIAPPLSITRDELEWGLERIIKVLGS